MKIDLLTALSWAWRLTVVALLAWIGWNLHLLERNLPAIDYQTEALLDRISSSLSEIERILSRR